MGGKGDLIARLEDISTKYTAVLLQYIINFCICYVLWDVLDKC